MQEFDPEEVRSQQEFLRRLARKLVRDEHVADDLVQETWVAALQAPAGLVSRLRPWLATVLRHQAINRSVADARRERRERGAAREEAREQDQQLDDLLYAQSRVLVALRELAEPQRRALYLRYAEGKGPKAIARELGVPVATIKARLARGREELRRRLDSEFGDRSWCLALAPSLAIRELGQASSLGALWMSMSWKVAATLALLGLSGVLLWSGMDGREAISPELVVAEESAAARERKPDEDDALEFDDFQGQERREATGAAAAAPPELDDIASTSVLRGLVLDARGRPVSGASVVQVSTSSEVIGTSAIPSSSGGVFELDTDQLHGRLQVEDVNWITVLSPLVTSGARGMEHVVVVAPRCRFAGHVVDSEGRALSGARIVFGVPDGLRRRFDHSLDRAVDVPRVTRSDELGRFEFDAGVLRASTLVTRLENFVPSTFVLDGNGGTENLELVLHRHGEQRDAIHGLVLDPSGWPVEGAHVSFGAEMVRSDSDGRFHLSREATGRNAARVSEALRGPSRTLRAVHANHLPAHLEVELDPQSGEPDWPDGLVLELGGSPLSISGRVVDDGGAPIENAWVWLRRATYFSGEGGGCSVEALMGSGPGGRHLMVRTDATGGFALNGLQDQDYAVVAADPTSFQQVHSAEVPAGSTGLELVIDSNGRWEVVRGRVVDVQGTPLPGVDINVMGDVASLYLQGEFVRTSSWLVSSTQSDDEGEFTLRSLPKRWSYLLLDGPESMTAFVPAEELGDADAESLDDVELVVTRRVHVRVTLNEGERGDEISILGEDHEPLGLQVSRGKPGPIQSRMPIHGDRTDILSVAETGRILVLFEAGEEVARRAILLRDGELNEL